MAPENANYGDLGRRITSNLLMTYANTKLQQLYSPVLKF